MQDLMLLDLPDQCIISGRYFARIKPGFGVTVFASLRSPSIRSPEYLVSFFGASIPPSPYIYGEYLEFMTKLPQPSSLFPSHSRVPDLLTIKCLIEDATENWSKARCFIPRP